MRLPTSSRCFFQWKINDIGLQLKQLRTRGKTMRQSKNKLNSGRSVAVLTLLFCGFALGSCGLGTSNQDRIVRGNQAFLDGDIRAAIIDAKNVLQKEPNNVDARLLLGRASVAIGDGAAAEKELRKAVELGTDVAAVLVELGRALLMQQKFDAVVAEIRPELAASNDDRLAALLIRGDAVMGLNQPAAAREIYTSYLADKDDDAAVQLRVVETYVGERNYRQARETLNQVLVGNENYLQAWLGSASLSMQLGNLERAASDFETATKLAVSQSQPTFEMQALFGSAEANFAMGHDDDVRPVLRRMQEIDADDTRTLMTVSRFAAVEKNWAVAQENLQEILRRTPDFRPAQLLLGAVHKESGNLVQAEMYLSAVVAALPANTRARQLLAATRIELGKSADALAAMKPVLSGQGADADSLSIAARASLEVGAFDDAVAFLEQGVEANPGNTDLQMQLAFAYLRGGRIDDAQAILSKMPAVEKEQDSIRRESLQVLAQMARGESSDALTQAKLMSERWPENIILRNLVASIEVSIGDYEAARENFEATLQKVPGDSGVMFALAKLAALSEDYDGARSWLEKARKADAEAVGPRVALGFLHIAFADYAAAQDVALEAQALDPDNARISYLLGLARHNQNETALALGDFERAVKLDPGEPTYRLSLARAHAVTGDKAAAQSILEGSFDQSLRHIRSGVALAMLKADAGDRAGAFEIAKKMQKIHPKSGLPVALEAELQVRSGDMKNAAAAYDRALSIELTNQFAIRAHQIRRDSDLKNDVGPLLRVLEKRPLESSVRLMLAQAHQNSKRIPEANAEYERVLLHDPKNFLAANNLAWNYFQAGDVRAEETARRAYEIQPENSSVVDTLGWILVKKGSLPDGVAMLRRAEELGDGRAEIRYHLAVGLAASGEVAEAKTILREILSKENDFSGRRQAKELLSTL